MFAAPWVCRRCLQSASRPVVRQFLRKASTHGYLPPALLERARKLTAEHDELAVELGKGFDAKIAKRAGELAGVATALKDLETAKNSIAELAALVQSSDKEMRELAQDEIETTTQELEGLAQKLSVALTPRDPYADMPCLIEFRPGPGGMEGRFFTDTLFKMYQAYCTRNGYRTRVVSYTLADGVGETGDEGENPLQEAILEVEDEGSYDIFRSEAGMHRVQRVPSTEKSGRTHTSAVAVWVLPSFPDKGNGGGEDGGGGQQQQMDVDDPDSDFYINITDVRVEKMRARGAGGQHVNKTESAIRLMHVPSGTVVSMQDHRSQHRNRQEAWKILRSRVAQQRRERREEEAQQLRSSVLSKDRITRGDKIRTYNYSQDRCTDHRSGLDVHNLPDVIAGGDVLGGVMASVREWMTARDVRMLIAAEEEEQAAAAAAAAAGKAQGKGKKT